MSEEVSSEVLPEATEAATPAAPPLSLEERIAYLESQNEGLKRVGLLGLVLVLVLGAILVHQTYSDLRGTTTRGLTLLNDRDELSSAITVDSNGRTQFLQARYATMASAIALPEDFQGYAFYDSDGNPRLVIGQDKDKHTVFQVFDPTRQLTFNPFAEASATTNTTVNKVAPIQKKPTSQPAP